MAKEKKADREAVRKAIVARREARKQEKTAQYTKMRETAVSPAKFAKILDDLVAKTARQADSMEALRYNLGLARVAKEAPTKIRIAAAKNYGKKFVRIADEQPDVLADALTQAYKGLDEQAAAMEIAAEALGIDLGATSAEKAFTDEGKHELELGEDKGEAVAEVEGPDFEAKEETEAEDAAEPADKPAAEPEEDKEASGNDAFSTDRDPSGAPKAPQKTQSPQAQGQSEQNKAGSSKTAMSRKDYILLADAIKTSQLSGADKEAFANHLSSSLKGDNSAFNPTTFVEYTMGRAGNRGGPVKPQGQPRKPRPAPITAPAGV
jgi:hypothetical protein